MRQVETVLEHLRSESLTLEVVDTFEEVRSFPVNLANALSALIETPRRVDAAVALAEQLHRLEILRRSLADQAQYRPSLQSRMLQGVVEDLNRLWPVYADALSAADPHSAQVAAKAGQEILDGSVDGVPFVERLQESALILANIGDEPSLLRRAFAALDVLYGQLELEELIIRGTSTVQEELGQVVSAELGVDYLLNSLLGEVYLDPEKLREKRVELRNIGHNKSRVLEVAAMKRALRDLTIARRDIFESLNHFALLTSSLPDGAPALRRFSKCVGEVYEATLPLYAWLLLLMGSQNGEDRYERLIEDNSTELVRKLAAILPISFGDAPAWLRNHGHHGRAFDVDEARGSVRISLRSHKSDLSFAEYVDSAYAFIESVVALQWALAAALEENGLEVPLEDSDAAAMGVTLQETAAVWMSRTRRMEVHSSSLDNGRWDFLADIPQHDVLAVAAGLNAVAGDNVLEIFVGDDLFPTQPHTIARSALERHASALESGDLIDQMLALLDLRSNLRRGVESLITVADVQFASVAIIRRLVAGELSVVKALRRLRSLALDAKALAEVRLIDDAFRTLRGADSSAVLQEMRAIVDSGLVAPSFPAVAAVLVKRTG